jgi:hypothetical protein
MFVKACRFPRAKYDFCTFNAADVGIEHCAPVAMIRLANANFELFSLVSRPSGLCTNSVASELEIKCNDAGGPPPIGSDQPCASLLRQTTSSNLPRSDRL